MRTNYASASDMTGNSYGTGKLIGFDPKRESREQVRLLEEKNEAIDAIIEIDRQIMYGGISAGRLSRLEKKRQIKLAVVAKCDSGKCA